MRPGSHMAKSPPCPAKARDARIGAGECRPHGHGIWGGASEMSRPGGEGIVALVATGSGMGGNAVASGHEETTAGYRLQRSPLPPVC